VACIIAGYAILSRLPTAFEKAIIIRESIDLINRAMSDMIQASVT
jgi:hypothetical protein